MAGSRGITLYQGLLHDGKFLSLSPMGQRAWVLLKFNTNLGLSGLGRYAWPSLLGTIVGLTNHVSLLPTLEQAAAIVEELTVSCFRYDRAAEVLWLVNAFKHEPSGPTVQKAVAKEIERLPSSPLLAEWWALYRERFDAGDAQNRIRRRVSTVGAASPDGVGRVVGVPSDRPHTVRRRS